MEVLDYGRCFVFDTSAIDGVEKNTCRTQILSKVELSNVKTGEKEDFYLGIACIGEHMHMKTGMAQVPTSEVCVITNDKMHKLVKKFANDENGVIQVANNGDKHRLFDGRYAYATDIHFELKTVEAILLESNEEILKATLGSEVMVGRTTIWDEKREWQAVLEYPIVYMNVHRPTNRIQVDVGPILCPMFDGKAEFPIEQMELGYILYQTLDKAEIVVRVPTDVAEGEKLQTLHYSKLINMDVKNEVFRFA